MLKPDRELSQKTKDLQPIKRFCLKVKDTGKNLNTQEELAFELTPNQPANGLAPESL